MKFFWIFLLLPFLGYSQQPSHYKLGEEELEGIDIYGVHHASNKNYYLATSSGVIVYNGYTFNAVDCAETLMGSVFNLVEDYSGNIYCNNLSGQVFKVVNERCELFFTVPDSAASADIGLEVDNQNRILVRARKLLFLNQNAELDFSHWIGYTAFPTRMADSSIWVYSRSLKQFAVFKNGLLHYRDSISFADSQLSVYNTIEFSGDKLQYQLNECKVFDVENSGYEELINPQELMVENQSYRLYTTTRSLWIAPNSSGVYQFNQALDLVNATPYFPKTLISTVSEDLEGNILMGTFGSGIIVIPNEQTLDFVLPDKDEKVISIERESAGNLYFGTLSGNIYRKESNEVQLVRKGAAKRAECLFLSDNGKLVIGDNTGAVIDVSDRSELNFNVGSMKDVEFVGDNRALIGSNIGAFWVDLNSGEIQKIQQLPFRSFCIGFNPETESVYAGTSKGLTILNQNEEVSHFKLNGKTVRPRDFHTDGPLVYVATADNGILIFDSDTIQSNWNTSNDLISNQILHLQVSNKKVVVSTDLGVQILDFDGNSLAVIQSSDGIASDKVSDFEYFENELWVVHRKGVQKVKLNELNQFDFVPDLEIQNLTINDTVNVSLGKNQFQSNEQKFEFDLSVHNLRYQKEITYEYKLEGAEAQWQIADYQNHIIQYQSLSPGNYTFKARALCRDKSSKEVIYKFTIATPFYMAWWFYALVSLGLIMLLVFWFRRRLKNQAFLAEQQNELNASKLTAIQSQMNPHFIFNALNSIQDLVLKGDVSNSYTYITKFADLVRRTLNYSDKDFIDFENELKLIELYLTLEKLRFKTNFEFTIDADGVEDIQLPPMLIQPFIENALVHGLLHREGEKKLELKFELEENLICTITDNGVGREKAKEIKERQRSTHESFSVNAIKRRFEILQRNFGGELGFETEDLQENGIATGTRVKLVIPVKRKF